MNRRITRLCVWGCTLSALLGGLRLAGAAQEEKVHDLTNTELTEEQLVEILTPASGPPEEPRPRGIGAASKAPAPVRRKCTIYRTRGIGAKPASDAVAIKVYFDYNSADLRPDATPNLDKLGRALSSDNLGSACIRIEGHTDNIGSDSYNERLSRDRAQSVVRYLTRQFGIDPERLIPVGYGESNPMANNNSEEGRSKNRRVQVVTLGYGQPES
ncbi:MAG TPA: OmpA family protein [Thermoanaerobaculia bacterium]|nr:OmpA family protein [Thermoanaerobaculia bacterium]